MPASARGGHARKIASLELARVHGADPAVVRADVVDLAKRFSLVTAYTSFVVVADESCATEGASENGEDGALPQGGTEDPLCSCIGAPAQRPRRLHPVGRSRRASARRGMKRSTATWRWERSLLLPGSLLRRRAPVGQGEGRGWGGADPPRPRGDLEGRTARRPWSWADMHPIARLTVPRLGIERPILSNASGSALAFGIGHIDGTAGPATAGNCVVAGHRDSWAAFLADLRVADAVVIEAPDAGPLTASPGRAS